MDTDALIRSLRESIGDLTAFGDGEKDNALRAKDREQFQFYAGYVRALERVAAVLDRPAPDPDSRPEDR